MNERVLDLRSDLGSFWATDRHRRLGACENQARKEYNSQRVTVDGAVIKPGIFPITGKMSLLQAIALAEGLSKIADPTGVVVFRQVNGQRMAARFDLKQVRGGRTADPNLVAGDIVMVD